MGTGDQDHTSNRDQFTYDNQHEVLRDGILNPPDDRTDELIQTGLRLSSESFGSVDQPGSMAIYIQVRICTINI